MFQRRSFVFAAMAIITSLVLVACPAPTDGGATGGDDGSMSDEAVSLRYMLWDANQLPAYEQCVAGFMEENPNITVEIEQLGWGDYWDGIQTGMVAGNAPDVFTNHLAKYPEFAVNGQLTDIQPFVERDGVDLDMYLEGLADLWARDGERFGLPKDWDTIAVIYNKDMLAAAGVTEEELNNADWNAQDGGSFEEIAAKVTLDANGNDATSADFDADNVEQYGLALDYAGADAYGQVQWSSFAVSNGWSFNDGLYDTKYYYDDEKFIDTIDWYAGLSLDKGIAAPFEEVSSLGSSTMFASGNAAMTTDGSWMIGFYGGNTEFPVGFARLPIGPEGRKSMFNGLADSIWIGTDHPEESWLLVKHLASAECANIVGDAGVVFPAQEEAVIRAQEAYASRDLDISAFTEQALEENGTFLFPVTDNASTITSIMGEAMDKIFLGEGSAEEVLSTASEEVNATFQ